MKKFLLKILLIAIPTIIALYLVVFWVPPGSTQKNFMLYALLEKNQTLDTTSKHRIIFVGGSNLSFGLDSKKIKDSLQINPINNGLHAGLGLKFMLQNCSQFIKEKDIIIISPEYEQFYGNYCNGNVELLTSVVDIIPSALNTLDFDQYLSIIPFLPKLAQMKLSDNLFPIAINKEIGIYDKKSFNSFGDTYIHWTLPSQKVYPYKQIEGSFNHEVIGILEEFQNFSNSKNARVFIIFPCIQKTSYNKFQSNIKEVEKRLKKSKLNIISTPERYIFDDTLMFNSQYHLNKKGVDIRTTKIIEDLKKTVYQ